MNNSWLPPPEPRVDSVDSIHKRTEKNRLAKAHWHNHLQKDLAISSMDATSFKSSNYNTSECGFHRHTNAAFSPLWSHCASHHLLTLMHFSPNPLLLAV